MGRAQRRRDDAVSGGPVRHDDDRDADAAPHHLVAIERLRRIAEQGLEEWALTGFGDSDEDGQEPCGGAEEVDARAAREAHLRVLEAVLFAAPEPVSEKKLARYIEGEADVAKLLEVLAERYRERGVNLVRVGTRWMFRTAADLAYLLEEHAVEQRRLSKAALETLAIIAYHQPVTRAEIEDVRGVTISKGTLDVLMETGWVRPRGRRRAPGKPVTYGTTETFLAHFGLDGLSDLPGLADLKASGLLGSDLPPDFQMPSPQAVAALLPDELPLEEAEDSEDGAGPGELDETGGEEAPGVDEGGRTAD
jgi:segregation and condensation protein B